MHTVAAGMRTEIHQKGQAGSDDQVGWILILIRAAEKVNLNRMRTCSQHCPLILDYVYCEDPEARSCAGMRELMRLAVQLSREELARELDILRTSGLEQDDPLHTKKKNSILCKFNRVLPGHPNSIGAIHREDGTITNYPGAMAEAIVEHWRRAFDEKPIDVGLLEQWLASVRQPPLDSPQSIASNPLPHTRSPRIQLPRRPSRWTIRRKDIAQAIRMSGNSSPGPDGIQFAVWRALKGVGSQTLYDVACAWR